MVWELSVFRSETDEWVSSVDVPELDDDDVRRLLKLDPSADVAGEFEVTGEALATLAQYTGLPADTANYSFYLGVTADEPSPHGADSSLP